LAAFSCYEFLLSYYDGWSLADVKGLSIRERTHWVKRAMWEIERRGSGDK
jgi:hypothetical protein